MAIEKLDPGTTAGMATNFGVESTGRAARDRGIHLVLIEDAITGLNAQAHEATVKHAILQMGLVWTASWVQEVLTR
jgi:nicotinamidase-related amidase